MTKKELKKELRNIKKLYLVGITQGTNPHWDKGIWRTFRVYYIKKNELRQVFINSEEKDKPAYWNDKKKVFECDALGTDRTFEIVYNLGRWLFDDGYKFKKEFLSWRGW